MRATCPLIALASTVAMMATSAAAQSQARPLQGVAEHSGSVEPALETAYKVYEKGQEIPEAVHSGLDAAKVAVDNIGAGRADAAMNILVRSRSLSTIDYRSAADSFDSANRAASFLDSSKVAKVGKYAGIVGDGFTYLNTAKTAYDCTNAGIRNCWGEATDTAISNITGAAAETGPIGLTFSATYAASHVLQEGLSVITGQPTLQDQFMTRFYLPSDNQIMEASEANYRAQHGYTEADITERAVSGASQLPQISTIEADLNQLADRASSDLHTLNQDVAKRAAAASSSLVTAATDYQASAVLAREQAAAAAMSSLSSAVTDAAQIADQNVMTRNAIPTGPSPQTGFMTPAMFAQIKELQKRECSVAGDKQGCSIASQNLQYAADPNLQLSASSLTRPSLPAYSTQKPCLQFGRVYNDIAGPGHGWQQSCIKWGN